MIDKNNRLARIEKFFKNLPKDLKKQFIDNYHTANRVEKREISKIKDPDKGIPKLLKDDVSRQKLIDSAYETVKQDVNLKINTSYDSIVNSITGENYIPYTIFFLYRLSQSEKSENEKSEYLEKFLGSPLFDCIIKRDINGIDEFHRNLTMSAVREDVKLNPVPIDSLKQFSTAVDEEYSPPETNSDGNNKIVLLGRIERRNNFYNFFPQYEYNCGQFREIPEDELTTHYPEKGSINLAGPPFSAKLKTFFETEIHADLSDDVSVKSVYLLELDNYDLQQNDNDVYKVKLDLENFIRKGCDLGKMIRPVSCIRLYKVAYCESGVPLEADSFSRNIFLGDNVALVENEPVLLFSENKYYGPFKVQCRKLDGKFYIKPDAVENGFVVPYYTAESVKKIEFEKQVYTGTLTDTVYARAIGDPFLFDAISDEILIERASDEISLSSASENPEEFVRLRNSSPFFSNLPERLVDNRIMRLQNIINSTEKFNGEKRKLLENLIKLSDEKSFEIPDTVITDSRPYRELQENFTDERRKNDEKEITIQKLVQDNEQLNTRLMELEANISSNQLDPEKTAQYEEEISRLTEKLSEEQEKNQALENIESLREQQKRLENNNDYLREKEKDYKAKISTLQGDISRAIKAGVDRCADVAFEPYIADAMMKAASQWQKTTEHESFIERKIRTSSIKSPDISGRELIDYIVDYVQKRRSYTRNQILNIYISIAQNFLTVFSGEPGSGKTSACNIIAESMGLKKFGQDIQRFIPVSVERGWSSRRDFIGYYNPLTRTYDRSSKVYDALRLLDVEGSESSYPFLIMLDEANLSPIEYYWADFMRLTDRSSSDPVIDIGSENDIFIPETLRFVATVNNDQTTENLSPRLIDRACIIKLPDVKPKKNIPEYSPDDVQIVSWQNFRETFSPNSELVSGTEDTLEKIYELFSSYGMRVSPRIQLDITKYVRSAQCIMTEEADALPREQALDYAVVQKLLPKINGYYSDYKRFFDSLKNLCKDNHLVMTRNAIENMENSQEKNMGYCQYLL